MRNLWKPAECKIAANLYRTIEPGHGAHMRMLEQIAARLGRPVGAENNPTGCWLTVSKKLRRRIDI